MLLSTLALILAADPLTPTQAAAIEVEQQKAQAEVNERFGNKPSSELTSDERREMIRAQADAEKKVLEKNGVDAKTWARYMQSRGRSEFKSLNDAKKELTEREKAKQTSAAEEQKEVVIEKGGVTDVNVEGSDAVLIDRGENDGDAFKSAPKAKAKPSRRRGRR
jgi:hypothetical protein